MRTFAYAVVAAAPFIAIGLGLGPLAGCSKGDAEEAFEEEDAGGAGGAEGGGARPPECTDDTKDIFVISEERVLYRFHPPTLAFTSIGILQCAAGGATPTSMAVDRAGYAWVRYTDGTIWRVSTRDLSCTATSFVPPQTAEGAFFQFGMGFATASKGGSAEELFLSDTGGAGLAKLDTTSMRLTVVGSYDGELAGKTSELTGTGDGKLYGFFVSAPAQIAEISKGTAQIVSSKELPGVYAGNAWAFSFYGGDFYVYTSSDGSGGLPLGGSGSDVTRYRPSTGAVDIVKSKIGFKIVGAGVSTCAPTILSPR